MPAAPTLLACTNEVIEKRHLLQAHESIRGTLFPFAAGDSVRFLRNFCRADEATATEPCVRGALPGAIFPAPPRALEVIDETA